MAHRSLLWIAILFEGGLVFVAWGLGAVLGTPVFGQLHLTGAAVGYGLLASLPMLAGLVWIERSRWGPLVRFREAIDEVVTPLFANASVGALAVISLLAGLGEEALFRGVLQTALAEGVGQGIALGVTSILFGLAHFITVTYVLFATIIGVYLGGLLLVFDNLLVPLVAHAAYDFIALVYLVFLRSDGSARKQTGD